MIDNQLIYLFCSILIGGIILCLLLLFHLVQTGKGRNQNDNISNTNEKELVVDHRDFNIMYTDTTNNKRQNRIKNKRRDIQQFSHPWMIGTLKGHTASILNLDFSANGKFLASCSEDRTVLIWCTKDLLSKERKSLRVNIEYDYASHVRWSPDTKAFIIHKSLANHIEVFKLAKKSDGNPASAFKILEFPKHHEEDIVGMDIACNGRFIVTCSKLNDLIIWDLKGQILSSIETYLGSTHRIRISPCGRFVAASGFTPDVKVWEVTFTKSGDFKQVVKSFDLAGHTSGVYDFAFNSDTSRMATVSKDGTYRFYNTKVEFDKGEDPHLISMGQWNGKTPATIALSPNAEIIGIAHGSSISFYSTVSEKLDTTLENVFEESITCITFDSLGEYVLAAGDRYIKIFRNIPGYRASIETARRKLSQKQTSATKERLETILTNCEKFLRSTGESSS